MYYHGYMILHQKEGYVRAMKHEIERMRKKFKQLFEKSKWIILHTYQYEMIIHAIEQRQSSYVVGDKMYNEYDEILNETAQIKSMTAMDWE